MHRAFFIWTLWLLGVVPSAALELVMFETKSCPWCAEWRRVIGPVYGKTPEGKRAPLRRIDLHAVRQADLAGVKPVMFTPTFVLVEEGVELGRIAGYPGEDFFWGMLGQELAKLPVPQPN